MIPVVILAGGKGTRLGIKDLPKPMVPVAGKPVLEHQIEVLRRYGFGRIILLCGYLAEKIQAHFGDGKRFGVEIEYVNEGIPLGTAGAILQLRDSLITPFMVLYGDVLFDMDLKRLQEFALTKGGLGTLMVHPNNHPYDSDLLEFDTETNRITAFHSKPHPEGVYLRNIVNAAVYIMFPSVFDFIPAGVSCDFGKDTFPAIVKNGGLLFAYKSAEYLKDMGTKDRLQKVEFDFLSGKISRLNRNHGRRAVFLDRDGVINEEVGGVRSASDFRLLPGVATAIKRLNDSDLLTVVVTNQPVIAKGFCTEEDVECIHKKMDTLLCVEGAFLDDIFICPHHPETGHKGERIELKIDCDCRKPKTGLIFKAADAYNIDLAHSFIVGDRYVDIAAGRAAGLCTILLKTGYEGSDIDPDGVNPDYVCKNLNEAVNIILKEMP